MILQGQQLQNVLQRRRHPARLAVKDRIGVPLDEVVEPRRRPQQTLADVVNALRLGLGFNPFGGAAGSGHAGGPSAALAHPVLVRRPAVGGRSTRATEPQVVVEAGHTLPHVEEDIVAVAAEQLLHEGQVLASLEQEDQSVVGAGSAQPTSDLLQVVFIF